MASTSRVGHVTAAVVLHDQRPRGRRLEARQRLEPLRGRGPRRRRARRSPRELLAARAARPVARRAPVGRRIGVDQEPADVDPRVADGPDLPVDDRGDRSADGEQVAEPEVAVHDRGATAGGSLARRSDATSAQPGRQRRVDGLEQAAPPLDLVGCGDDRFAAEADVSGRRRAARQGSRCVPHALAPRLPRPRRRRRSNSGSSDVPSTNGMTNSGGTSGGSPASSQITSGTGTAVPCSARSSRAWRSTSRFSTGGSPGGATLTTTCRSPSRAEYVRLDAPPVSGRTSPAPSGDEPIADLAGSELASRACA